MTDELANRYHDLMLAPGARQAMIARMQQIRLVDPVPLLRRIQAPTLLLWGELDAMIPISNAQDYLKAISNVRLARLPGLGHLPHEEAPMQTLPALKAFLAETPATGVTQP
jgi:pimeloyl-ACP methyl ester carboxylesterase